MKKNIHFRRIPDYIEQELQTIQSQHIVVASLINADKEDINNGKYYPRHMDIGDGRSTSLTPDQLSGLFARYNRNGRIWILKDLPKITKTYSWDVPNFGDSSNGTHTIFISREVYQRRLEPPRDWEITLSVISEDDKTTLLKAQIAIILDRQKTDFKNDLFFAINLLQERFQDCHVLDAKTSNEELARVTKVGWDIFPPGTIDLDFSVITRSLRNQSPERKQEIQSRAAIINSLHPTEFILGNGMNSRYYGAKYGDNIVVFENLDYGNALYILFDNWQDISKMSRIDILKRHERDYIRIIHKVGWEKTLKHHIEKLRGK